MKQKIQILSIVLTMFFINACDVLNQVAVTNPLSGPTDQEIGMGLKEALNVGIKNGVQQLMKSDGYFKNQFIKILMPPEVKNAENLIRKNIPGGNKLIEDLILKMNRSAEEAAKEAVPIFANAITSMSITDAKNILFGNSDAATTYLKGKTFSSLTSAYSPKINNAMEKVGASQAWSALVNPYNKFVKSALGKAVAKDAKPIQSNLGDYVTQKALDGLFFKVKGEEKKIRENVGARVTDLLKKVFGELDKR